MKIGIVGTGMVGSTAAYALVMRGVGREIVLIDKNEKRVQDEADALKASAEVVCQAIEALDAAS